MPPTAKSSAKLSHKKVNGIVFKREAPKGKKREGKGLTGVGERSKSVHQIAKHLTVESNCGAGS